MEPEWVEILQLLRQINAKMSILVSMYHRHDDQG